MNPLDIKSIATDVSARKVDSLAKAQLEDAEAERLAHLIRGQSGIYEPLLLGTAYLPKWPYDWNIGFLIPHLHFEDVVRVITNNKVALAKSEGIAWGLGELGSDDHRVVDFLFSVCEQCLDYDAWWCAAEALEKIGECDATDLKKRTLKGDEWATLSACLQNLDQRPAIIGILKQATLQNTSTIIIPACRRALKSTDRKTVQNSVWLIERLRVDDNDTLDALQILYEKAEDKSHTLRPRVVEALGRIASPSARILLETALADAQYYRTRAYAALGLAKIGDSRSLNALQGALDKETDFRVLPYISEAIYSIKTPSVRSLIQLSKDARWPENGMIVDQTNKWYTNPEIYDKFSLAEDPLALSFNYAISQIPLGVDRVIDLGTGTGRFALHLAKQRPDIGTIYAVDSNDSMHDFLVHKLKPMPGLRKRISPIKGDNGNLPVPDNSVAAALSSWGFPSNMWNVETCLRELLEVRRVLSPGGHLITIGWDETFRDELSELWYRFVPEPDFRRESIEEWRKRRRDKIKSPRNCHLNFIARNFKVPLLFENSIDAAYVLGFLFGYTAGEWVAQQQRCEFSISVGITRNTRAELDTAISYLEKESAQQAL